MAELIDLREPRVIEARGGRGGGARVPRLLYGTAWKEEATAGLVEQALAAGFRGIDTANQRKHYAEAGVGEGLARFAARAPLPRSAVFLQTKYTFRAGQDDRLPYDPAAPVGAQVAQSFERSLVHLGVSALDSLVLHGPSRREGLGPDDRAAWAAMEELAGAGRVALLGVSNVTAEQIEALTQLARIPPALVQNRCYAARGWDAEVRAVCQRHGIAYQGFSLLTANRHVLAAPAVRALADARGATPAQIVFRFALQRGMLPLTGTRDPAHMAEDLAALEPALHLAPGELATIEAAGDHRSP
jgi:diketogulonate reductase-like aldo/keto reductase